MSVCGGGGALCVLEKWCRNNSVSFAVFNLLLFPEGLLPEIDCSIRTCRKSGLNRLVNRFIVHIYFQVENWSPIDSEAD